MNPTALLTRPMARAQPKPALDRLATALVILAGIASAMHVGKGASAMPELAREFARSLASLGWVVSVFALLGVVGGMAAGGLAARLGDRRVLVAGLAILGAASLAGALAPSYGWLMASRVVEGAGFLLVVVAAPAVLNRLTPPAQRNMVFGFWSTFMGIGIALAMLLSPVLSWRALWLLAGALTLALGLAVAVRVPRAPVGTARDCSGAAQAPSNGALRVLRARAPWLLALSFAAYNLQFFALMAFLPSFLMQRVGFSVVQAGVASALIVLANIAGNLAAGAWLQRGVRPARLMAWTCAVTGLLGVAAFLPALPALAVIALCALFSATAGVLPATFLARAPAAAPAPALVPLSLGMVMQGNYLGQVLAPALAGALVALGGWTSVAWQIGAGAALGIALALCYQRDS